MGWGLTVIGMDNGREEPKMKRIVLFATLLSVVAGAAWAADDLSGMSPEQVVSYRQDAFHEFKENSGMLRSMLKDKSKWDQAAAQGYVSALEQASDRAFAAFLPGTAVGESEALPRIWEEPELFKQAQGNFKEALANVKMAVDKNDPDLAAKDVAGLGRACKGCHDGFRQP